jgi:hypothetical protein
MGIVQPTGFIKEQTPPTYLGFTTGSSVYLNANNRTSYPGSGSIWYDLSGNGRNAAITGSVVFTNGGTGSVSYFYMGGATGSFDTVDNNIVVSSAVSATGVTFGGWCKAVITNSTTGSLPPASSDTGYVPLYSYGVATSRFDQNGISNYVQNNFDPNASPPIERSIIGAHWQGGSTAFIETTTGYFYNYNNKWMHLMLRWQYKSGSIPAPGRLDNVQIYVNGTYQNNFDTNDGETGFLGADNRFRMGAFTNTGQIWEKFLNGSFSTLEAYDRYLTPDEIYGNFNVSKSFYGY